MSEEQEQKSYDWADWGGMQPRGGCGCGCLLLIILAVGLYLWLSRKVPEPEQPPVPVPVETAPVLPEEKPEVPLVFIETEVLLVNEEDELLIVGAGETEGVESGDPVKIMRDNEVIATGRISYALEGTSGVMIVESKQEVRESDRVTIQITP